MSGISRHVPLEVGGKQTVALRSNGPLKRLRFCSTYYFYCARYKATRSFDIYGTVELLLGALLKAWNILFFASCF